MKRPFRSCLVKQFEEFVYSKRASQRWCQSYEENLHFFDNYCADMFPNDNSRILACVPGDANGDGLVNAADVLLVQQRALGSTPLGCY